MAFSPGRTNEGIVFERKVRRFGFVSQIERTTVPRSAGASAIKCCYRKDKLFYDSEL